MVWVATVSQNVCLRRHICNKYSQIFGKWSKNFTIFYLHKQYSLYTSGTYFFLLDMKKIILTSLLALSSQLSAQEIMPNSLSTEMASVSNNLGFDIIGVLFVVFFYIALPVIFYCISSYSLSLLNKHYNKKTTSGISWIPFVRYYDFIKQATKSPKKAFFVTLFPWIIAVLGILGGIIVGITGSSLSMASNSWVSPAFMIFGSIIILGILGIVVMNFWRAFIISKYVKWDVTTALGLSTYTTIVLWYIALDRVRKNTNIIGILGFIAIGLVICFYIGILFILGFTGLSTFLGI